jgi:hypothetical protein
MSACCSLDRPGKPSFVEHRSRLPPSQIAWASYQAHHHRAHNTAGLHQPGRTPRFLWPTGDSSGGGCVPPHGPLWRADGCSPGRRARLPRQGACTGGSRLWFPVLRLAFQKWSPSCENSGGRRWVRTTGFSLVRRIGVRIAPQPSGSVHAAELRKPCREMS